MKAIILAAGRGSRMKESTESQPKCLVKLWNKTLLDYTFDALNAAGISNKNIAIVTGYKNHLINAEKITKFHNAEWMNTNMVASLLKAESWLSNGTNIICYSDIIFDPKVIRRINSVEGDIVLPYYTEFEYLWRLRFENPLDDLESFMVDEMSNLIEIGQKVENINCVKGQYMGLIKVTDRGWKYIRNIVETHYCNQLDKLDMTTLLNRLIASGIPIKAVPCSELWLECDNENDKIVYEKNFNRNEIVT